LCVAQHFELLDVENRKKFLKEQILCLATVENNVPAEIGACAFWD
jgi:hypothetical protein